MPYQHRRIARRITRYALAVGWAVLAAVILLDWAIKENLVPAYVYALMLSGLVTGSLTYSVTGVADRVVHRMAAVSGRRDPDDQENTGSHIATIYQLGKHAGERGIGS